MAAISRFRWHFVLLVLLSFGNLTAQQPTSLQALTLAVADQLIPLEKRAPNLMDCSQVSTAELESRGGARMSQWIYNGCIAEA